MAVVLKRDSELGRARRKIRRKRKIEKITKPIVRFVKKVFFALFTLCILTIVGYFSVLTVQALWNTSPGGVICICIITVVLMTPFELQAWKVCTREKERNTEDAQLKGADGEEKVAKYIEANMPNDCYLMNDINLRYNGKSSQFDHILVCPQGIFCLETKNYTGHFYLSKGGQWMFFSGKERKYTESPQEQSCYHSRLLSEILPSEKHYIFPLVIFANPKTKYSGTDKPCPVLHLEELKQYISSCEKVYTKKEAGKIAKKILALNVGVSKYKEKKI